VKRRYRRSRLPEGTAVVAMIVLAVVVVVGRWNGERAGDPEFDSTPSPVRKIAGRVVGDGQPVASVSLALFEGDYGPVAETTSGDDGAFVMRWVPRTTHDRRKLVLVARDPEGRYARTVAAPSAEFELRPAVDATGVVLNPLGERVAGATVSVAVLGRRFAATTSGEDGSFRVPGVPHGAPMDVFVCGAGLAPSTFRGFRAGDQLHLHVREGRAVKVRVRDPDGAVVAGAVVRPAVPVAFREDAPTTVVAADGSATLPAVAADASALIEASADGYLSVFIDTPTFGQVEAVLWPARTVSLRAWNGLRRRGIVGIAADVNLTTGDDAARWNGPDGARSFREYRLVAEAQRGRYSIVLPRYPVTLNCTAAAFADREITISEQRESVTVHMAPLRERRGATLVVRSTRLKGVLWLVVADEEEQWYSAFALRNGEGRATVPVGRELQLASAGAAEGLWLPKSKVAPIRAGRKRVIKELPLTAAAELTVTIEPPVASTVTLVDKKFGKAAPIETRETSDRTTFWVRPRREITVTVQPAGNWRKQEGEFEVGVDRSEWTAYMQEASGFRVRLKDVKGNAVPFAAVHVWEASRGGRLELRAFPREFASDALGVARVVGLRNGPTPIEIRAVGFRTRRIPGPTLTDGDVKDLGTIVLQAAPTLRGRVLDPDGNPLGGVRLRTVARGLRRLELPGGGARDLYDLVDDESADAISDAQGNFAVRDATPRLPLLVADAPGRYDLARAIVVVPRNPSGVLIVRLPRAAHIGLALPMAADGVFMLLSGTRAVRLYAHGALSLNPMPLTLPAGQVSLYVRLRNGRWSAPVLELKPGEHRVQLRDFGPR